MLARPTPRRLCSRCRDDLQSLFVSGFCHSPRQLVNSARPTSRTLASVQICRTFTSSTRWRQYGPDHLQPSSVDSQQRSSDGERPPFTPIQAAALHQLEKVLGMPIDDAIQDDELRILLDEAQTKLENRKSESQEEPANQHDSLGANDAIKALRMDGGTSSDVATLARQLYGEHLPIDTLQAPEKQMYLRMYGEPLPEATKDHISVEQTLHNKDTSETSSRGEILDADGNTIERHRTRSTSKRKMNSETLESSANDIELRAATVADLLDAEYTPADDLDSEEEVSEDPHDRAHPMTTLGKSGTRRITVALPSASYTVPLQNMLSEYSNNQLKDVAERTFGGPGLPDSPLTPRTGRSRKQVPVPLQASQSFMGEMEANAFVSTIIPPAYAAISSVLTETHKRLGTTWLTELLARPGGPRILDAGAGGAGVMAWNEVIKAHWSILHSSDQHVPKPPPSKAVVLTGSDPLRHRSAALLENTTFIPRLPDYVHTRDKPTLDDTRKSQQRKQFDVIISTYSLLPFKEDWERKMYVQNLWALLSDSGGILILIEKGMPRGFESIAGARDMLLERYIASPAGHNTQYAAKHQGEENPIHHVVPGMIVAPCTNHEKCPMYHIPGVSQGRKDFCSFQQRYFRPPQLQRILGATVDRNYGNVDFSYLSVMKGRDLREHQFSNWHHLSDPLSSSKSEVGTKAQCRSNTETWQRECKTGFAATTPESVIDASSAEKGLAPTHLLPRLVDDPIKCHSHVLLDVCTPRGTLERWTVPRSFSKQAYRDSRKAKWGDLWALGAKTVVPRKIRLGADSKENRTMANKEERRRSRAHKMVDDMHQGGSPQVVSDLQLEDLDEDEEADDVDDDDEFDDEIDDDVKAEMWQDLNIGEVEVSPKPARSPKRDRKTRGGRASPKKAASTPGMNGHSGPEDIKTRQIMAEWDAEFARIGKASKESKRLERASSSVTGKSKRKYREAKRNGSAGS